MLSRGRGAKMGFLRGRRGVFPVVMPCGERRGETRAQDGRAVG